MVSLDFPKMFKKKSTNILTGKEATVSNLKLLLRTTKGSLFGDPYYGTKLKTILFELNDAYLVDVIKDEIYTNIVEFMPQLVVARDNIRLVQNKTHVSIEFTGKNLLDGTVDLYTIRLIEDGETY